MARFETVEPTPKEIREQVREQEEKVRGQAAERGEFRDIFTVEGLPPGMEACWLNTRKDLLEASKWRDKYEIVNSQNAPNVKTIGKQLDGTHIIGDAILAMRPKEIGEKLEKERRELAKARLRRIKREFIEEGLRHGVKTFDSEE